MPEGAPLQYGPHRIKLFIDTDDYGNPALFAQAFPAVGNFEEFEDEYDQESYLVSRSVQGLEILLWDEELEDWIEEWEKENSVPERVMVRVYIASDEEDEEPIVFTRVIDIPVAKSVASKLTGPSKSQQKK